MTCLSDWDLDNPRVAAQAAADSRMDYPDHLFNQLQDALKDNAKLRLELASIGSDDHLPVATELLTCFRSWEPDVRVLGNVRAEDGARLMQAVLDRGLKEPETWVPCSERLPEPEDLDFAREVIAWDDIHQQAVKVFPETLTERKGLTHWMRTGLKDPSAPTATNSTKD